jgi:hypothetical protein
MLDYWVDGQTNNYFDYYNDEIMKFIKSPLWVTDENIMISDKYWTDKLLKELEKINDNF